MMLLRTSSTRHGFVRAVRTHRRALSVVQDAVDVEPAGTGAQEANVSVCRVRHGIHAHATYALLQIKEAWLFVDSVFPTRLGSWEYVL